MRFDDQGPYNPTAAHIARLDGSSPFPQVVVTHFTGGAHCCTDMTVLTFVDGRWQTVDVGEFDSDGPRIEDLNGDGAAELVGKDDSFDYAFASYAASYAPPKVLRLAGARIVDASHNPEFRRPILQMLLANQGLATPDEWRDNGFLGGWVAHNALVGNGAEAWRRMLDLYDRNSDWDLSVCAIATKGGEPCPDYAKRRRDFRPLCENFSPKTATASTAPAPLRSPARVPASTATRPGRRPRSRFAGLRGSPSWTTFWPLDTRS